MSKFVVNLNGGTVEERNALTALFNAKPWGVWHYFEDSWLLTSVDGMTAKSISEMIDPIVHNKSHLVIEIQNPTKMTYWGRANQNGWEWMKIYWGTAG